MTWQVNECKESSWRVHIRRIEEKRVVIACTCMCIDAVQEQYILGKNEGVEINVSKWIEAFKFAMAMTTNNKQAEWNCCVDDCCRTNQESELRWCCHHISYILNWAWYPSSEVTFRSNNNYYTWDVFQKYMWNPTNVDQTRLRYVVRVAVIVSMGRTFSKKCI